MSARILLADSNSLSVIGAETVLLRRAQTTLSRAENGSDLIATAKAVQPNIILLGDHFDPLIDTLALVEQLRHAAPSAHIMVMGTLSDGLLIRDLFAAGAKGYLMVGDDLSVCLPMAVEMALRDRSYLSPTANAEYLSVMQSPLRDWKLDTEARTVLRLLVRGLHVSDIARQMDVPLRRIYWVRLKLRRRFGVQTNEHLISVAIQEGFAFPAS
ncbi:MAG: response regulator transcription factor [Anaerolineae bacterium]|nr:response regulator transcription factor [Anaerolineae bacterium]